MKYLYVITYQKEINGKTEIFQSEREDVKSATALFTKLDNEGDKVKGLRICRYKVERED